MVYSVLLYQWKQITEIHALGSALEKFDGWNQVAPQSKFPWGPLDFNLWVDPNEIFFT